MTEVKVMIWNHPAVFLTLLAFPPLFYIVARSMIRRRRKIEAAFAEDLRVRILGSGSRSILVVKYIFLLLALVAFVCVFAGPRFGKKEEMRKVLGRDVFVLFDVSDSMLAEDVSPNRLTVARLDVEDLLDAAVGDRIGLVAFAGSAQVEIPLTTDYEFFRELLRKVDTKTVRLAGTATGDAIRLALKRFGQEPERKRLIFLITDGEDHDSLPLEAAKNAAEMGIPIVTVGIGSPNGAKIPNFNVNGERTGFKTFDGQTAISKTDVDTLKEIAKISKGRYFYADSKLNFTDVYKASVQIQDRDEISDTSRVFLKDRYQPFLAVGLFTFMLYYFCPTRLSLKIPQTIATLILISICMSLASTTTYATTPDDNDNEIRFTSKHRSKNQEIRAYNQSLTIANDNVERFAELQNDLTHADNPEVASRASYNLAVVELHKALEAAKSRANDADHSPQDKKASQEKEVENSQSQEIAEKKQIDPVAEYDAARKERDRIREEIITLANDASVKFLDARTNRTLGQESTENAEVVSNWRANFDHQEREDEIKIRSNVFQNSSDHLRWLQKELNETIGSIQDANPKRPSASFYRSLANKRIKIGELKEDANSIATKLRSRLVNSDVSKFPLPDVNTTPSHNAITPQTNDAEGAEIIAQALNRFDAHILASSEKIDQYEANAARIELRRAETQLTTFHDVPSQYDVLVVELSQNESKISQDIKEGNFKTSNPDQVDDYRWSREKLRLSVDETMRKARQIVKEASEEGQDSQQKASISESIEWNDSFDANSGEPIFDSNDLPESADTSERSYENRALESAKIALVHEQELKETIEKAGSLAQSYPLQEQDKKDLAQKQNRIAEILKDIAKPFQDENKQNQNQNQQNQSNGDQNLDNKDQKDESDGQKDQKNNRQQTENEEIPDELDQPESEKEENDSNSSKALDVPQKDVAPDTEESEQKKMKASEEPKTEEQKQADELMRQVLRRQKDAEPQREAVRQALKRREKSGKDW